MADNKISYFLNVFLQRPASSIPKGSHWAVFFDNIAGRIMPAIDLAYETEPYAEMWSTRKTAQVVLNREYNEADGLGCLFCQAIDLPGEGSTPIAEGNIKYNGFIRGYVGAGRNDFPVMRMSFLDTNISFTETLLRGWALATAKFGMIARNDSKNYRTDMTCIKFVSTPLGMKINATAKFKDICCISIDNQELNHDHQGVPIKRNAQFVYQSYSMNTVTDVSEDLLKNNKV
jgi:hypothetical protein